MQEFLGINAASGAVAVRNKVVLLAALLSLQACGVGSYGDDEGAESGGNTLVSDAEQLTIQLSGEVKYLAGEQVALSYEVSGSSSPNATVSYEGPSDLAHDSESKEISGALTAGIYDVKVVASSDSNFAEDEVQITADAIFSGSYTGSDSAALNLAVGRSSVTEVDENNYVLTRTGKLYWFAQNTDTGFVSLLCSAEIVIVGAEGSGGGFCKELNLETLEIYEISGVTVSSDITGQIVLSYLPEGTSERQQLSFASSGEAYVSPDIDISGVYRSQLLADLNFVLIAGSEISGDSYGNPVSRCNLDGRIAPYEVDELSEGQSVDGSVMPVSELTIDNCDLSDQQGYIVSVGLADGSAQNGLIQVFESGLSDSVLRFDLYAERGLEYADPISKLRFERICFDGVATSMGAGVVDDVDCEELMSGLGE